MLYINQLSYFKNMQNYRLKKKQRVLHKLEPEQQGDEYIDFLDNESNKQSNASLKMFLTITASLTISMLLVGGMFILYDKYKTEQAIEQINQAGKNFQTQMNQISQRSKEASLKRQQQNRENQIRQQKINKENRLRREKEAARKQQLAKTCAYWRTETARNNTSKNRNYRDMACSRK